MHQIAKLLALSLAALGLSACGTTQEARDVALLTQEQVIRLKVQTVRQEQLLQEQRTLASARIGRQLVLQEDLRDLIALTTTDWGDAGDSDGKAKLGLLGRLRAGDARLRQDPFVLLTGEPLVTPSFSVAKADRSGLDKTLAGVGRLTGKDRLGLDDLVAIAQEVNEELARLQEEQAQAEVSGAETGSAGGNGS